MTKQSKPGRPDKKIIGIVVVSVVILACGFALFLDRKNEGNLWLSGNSDKKFVKQEDADATYTATRESFGLSRAAPVSLQRPYFAFGYQPGLKGSSARWWSLREGRMSSQYDSIPLTQESISQQSQNLHKSGWTESPDLDGKLPMENFGTHLQKEIEKRNREIERLQRGALQPACIKSEYCQEQHESALRKVNDKPLEVRFRLDKGPYKLFLEYQTDADAKQARLTIQMKFSFQNEQ